MPKPGNGQRHTHTPVRTEISAAVNVLSSQLDTNLLSAVLGITSQSLDKILTGKPDAGHLTAHVTHRITEAGIPASWIENPEKALTDEQLDNLKSMASKAEDKTAIRQFNFGRLKALFNENISTLADALELTEFAVRQIAIGALPLDDERFGHINPRLVKAGLPDAWLEMPNTDKLDDDIKTGIKQLADSEHEDLTEVAKISAPMELSQVAAKAQATPDFLGADTVHVASAVTSQDCSPVSELPKTAQVLTFDSEVGKVEAIKLTNDISNMPIDLRNASLIPYGGVTMQQDASRTLLGAQMAPTVADYTIPGTPVVSVRKSRTVVKDIDSTAVVASSQSVEPTDVVSPAALAATATSSPKVHTIRKQIAGADQPQGNSAGTSTGASKKSAKATSKSNDSTKGASMAAESIDKERSKSRMVVLDAFMKHSRRGAKICLWEDLLGKSLPIAGNMRSGQIVMRDSFARQIESSLGLPENWLDNPTHLDVFSADAKPSNIPVPCAAWIFDASVSLPRTKGTSSEMPVSEGAGDASKLTANEAKASETPTAAKKAPKTTNAKVQTSSHDVAATQPVTSAATVVQPVVPVAVAQPVAPSPATMFQASVSGTASESSGTAGPVVIALVETIKKMAGQGRFTEKDALALLNQLMA